MGKRAKQSVIRSSGLKADPIFYDLQSIYKLISKQKSNEPDTRNMFLRRIDTHTTIDSEVLPSNYRSLNSSQQERILHIERLKKKFGKYLKSSY